MRKRVGAGNLTFDIIYFDTRIDPLTNFPSEPSPFSGNFFSRKFSLLLFNFNFDNSTFLPRSTRKVINDGSKID